MKLEERIKQSKPFRTQAERALVNVMYTSVWLQDRMRDNLSDFEITQQQYNVLRILRGQSPKMISTSDIRDRMIDRAPDTSRIVDRLVAKGFVEKSTCSSDKRRVDVGITKKGLQLLQEVDERSTGMQNLIAALSEEECVTLNTILDKLQESHEVEHSSTHASTEASA